MPKCKALYKNEEKYKAYVKRHKNKNYERSRKHSYSHKWTTQELILILTSPLTDYELSKQIHHSVEAIQLKRHRLNNPKKK